ncbi:MAG: gliding motility-associated C-terminal domain-containing protein, partial [Bacteroidota bacterium]
FDGEAIENGNTLLASVDNPGDYLLKITDSSNGCENEVMVIVLEDITPPVVQIEAPEEIICDRPVGDLDGSGSSAGNNFSYRWSTTDGNLMESNNKSITMVDRGGTYVLEVTNVDNGCTANASVVVSENVNRPTAVELEATPPRCFGEPGALAIGTITGGEGPYLYSFDGGESFGSEAYHPSLPTGPYTVVVMDINGCEYAEDITVPETFKLEVDLPESVTIALGDKHQLETSVNVPRSDISNIVWTTIDSLSCDNCLQPVVAPIENTEYAITVRDQNGCTATARTLLRIDRRPLVFIPNAFSPGTSAGVNDRFTVYGKASSIREIKTFQVFNRWGAKLYEANNFQPNDEDMGWDGRYGSKVLQPAVFVYFVEIEFIDGRTELFEGDVLLVK